MEPVTVEMPHSNVVCRTNCNNSAVHAGQCRKRRAAVRWRKAHNGHNGHNVRNVRKAGRT
ncbi:hypothetical protein BKK81_02855 [Cupriavidus sp. USMAHM13]|nr:hypothetical protein BKK81_02855 [Cupriavidus sp. USMAHM13]